MKNKWQWNILEKNPKILNPGNQSQHRWNKKWQWNNLEKNPNILNPGNQSQHRWNQWWQWNILEKNPKILNPGNQSQHYNLIKTPTCPGTVECGVCKIILSSLPFKEYP